MTQRQTPEDDEIMVICSENGRPHVKGKWVNCSNCALEIFLSDSSINSVVKSGLSPDLIKTYCLDCGMPIYPRDKVLPLTQEQITEIRKGIGI